MSVDLGSQLRAVVPATRRDARIVIWKISVVAALVAIPVAVALHSTALTPSISAWVVPVAIVALGLGIPHGAVDHLTLTKSLPPRQLVRLGLIYLLIAALGTALILAAPVPAFVAVIAFTIWHFGTGDVEATHALQGTPEEHGIVRVIHVLAAGSAPVLLPLTSPAAAGTLALLQPDLASLLTPTVLITVRTAVLLLVVVAVLIFIMRENLGTAIELAALAALGYFATPLLAFAVYFGFWHALRHTARLAEHRYGRITFESVGRTFLIGVPSLIGFIVVVSVLAVNSSSVVVGGEWLWFGLAVVWGLTIPHMVMVSAFDRRQRANTALPS